MEMFRLDTTAKLLACLEYVFLSNGLFEFVKATWQSAIWDVSLNNLLLYPTQHTVHNKPLSYQHIRSTTGTP